MSEPIDLLCEDDRDAFGREATLLESIRQDAIHWLFCQRGELVFEEDFGFGIGSYVGQPAPSTLGTEIEEGLAAADDRIGSQAHPRIPHERRGSV